MKLFPKFLFVVLMVAFVSSAAFGQAYNKADKTLNAGVGFGGAFFTGESTLPPISLGLQLGLEDKISVGGIVGYAGSSDKFLSYEWKYTYILIGGRGEYHFLDSKHLDAFVGVTLGYNIVSVTAPTGFGGGYSAASSALWYGGNAGLRYYFSPTFGLFAEVGYGISYLTAGVALKL
jgi:hypothetical protein